MQSFLETHSPVTSKYYVVLHIVTILYSFPFLVTLFMGITPTEIS